MPQTGEGSESQWADRGGEQIKGNQPPLITVITPCLNAIESISENLSSVLAAHQVLEKAGWGLEHLVVEGGSLDGTAELVANHAAQHSYFSVTSNIKGGPYAAMNAGLGQASGSYTHVLNSDDLVLDPIAYANFVMEGHRKGATVLISSIGYFRRPSKNLKSLWIAESIPAAEGEWQHQLLNGLHYPHPGFIADTTIYKKEGFDERYSLSADYKLMQRILVETATPESTVVCRQPLVAMAEGGATGNWRAILKGRQQLAAINQELGIKASSVTRYWLKVMQRMRPIGCTDIINSVGTLEP
jgi:glycosyltransferase involved in cell wall biosynthesis